MVMFFDMSKEEALSPLKSSLRHNASKLPLLQSHSSNRKSLKALQEKPTRHFETEDERDSIAI